MKRWYRKTVVKVVAVIVGIVSGAVFAASLLAAISLAGTVNPSDIRRIMTQEYEDSEDFNMSVENSVYEIMNRIGWNRCLRQTELTIRISLWTLWIIPETWL